MIFYGFRFYFFILCAFLLGAMPAHAFNKVSNPDIVDGRTELEYRGGYDFDQDAVRNAQGTHKFIANHAFTDRFRSEVKLNAASNHGDYDFIFLEWGNRFQLIKNDPLWPRLSLQENYRLSLIDGRADRVEFSALLGKDFGKVANIVNINLESEVGADHQPGISFNVALKTRYLLDENFEPGLEIYDDFGKLNEANPRNSKKSLAGPTISGNLLPGTRYDTGLLFGISEGAPDVRFKLILTQIF